MTFPLITDPFFYAVAIPAVLLLGISKSGFGAGFGSLAVPMMAMAVTVPQAAAILMPVLLVMDLLGMAAFRKDFDKKLLVFLIPFGLLGTLIGTLLFKVLDSHTVAGLVGVFTLLFLAQRLLFPPKPNSAATAGANWRVGGCSHRQTHQPSTLLSFFIHRHVFDRGQIGLGCLSLISSAAL